MNHPEREYISLCKRLIEEKFHFENGNGNLRQRDLEWLADSIEEASGIKLSLSTLKRLWKKDHEQMPHPSTLDALVSILGYKSWQDFKLKETGPSPISVPEPQKKAKRIFTPWTITAIGLAIIVLSWLIAFRIGKEEKGKPIIKGPSGLPATKPFPGACPTRLSLIMISVM